MDTFHSMPLALTALLVALAASRPTKQIYTVRFIVLSVMQQLTAKTATVFAC